MGKTILLSLLGLFAGILVSLLVIFSFLFFIPVPHAKIPTVIVAGPKQVIGFLPYWLLGKAKTDYSNTITTLSYFALRISSDGSILKLNSPTEEESGWHALESGVVDPFLQTAKENHLRLSLVLDSGDVGAINALIADPVRHSKNLVNGVLPIMKQYGFSDLNLDIEYTQTASDGARVQFTEFIKQIRKNLPTLTTLTLEISPIDAVQKRLINIQSISRYADHIVLMAYDYHAPDSFVTGPVAPLFGAGIVSEYDVATAVQKTLGYVSPAKLILGIPLYGYEWETLKTLPRSAIIAGSGVLASSSRVETLIAGCTNCTTTWDPDAEESYTSFFDENSNTNNIIFAPDIKSTSAKIDFVQKNGLGGVALWALGYEGGSILTPISTYKNN